MAMYDRTRITFHRGNGFAPEGITSEPFAVLTIDDLVDDELIEALCTLVRNHVHLKHADFCNVKLSTEQWDV